MNKININVFCYDRVIYPVSLSDKCFNNNKDLLLIFNKFTSHYVYIKDFDRLMFNKSKCLLTVLQQQFTYCCLQCLSSENIRYRHKEDCLMINGKQNVELEKGFISFKNFNGQIPVPFKIYADFECLLKGWDSGIHNERFSYERKYQDHIPCSFACKVVCFDNKYSKDVVLYRRKNAVLKFIASIFKECEYCKNN